MSAILEGVKVPAPSSVPTPPRPVLGLSLGGLPTPFTPANGEFARVAIRADLAVMSPEGYVLDTVSFVFQQRVASPLFVTVVGMDATRAVNVTLQIQNDSRSARLNISYREERANRPMHARQLYPLMRFLAKIRPPNRIGIVINGRSIAEDPVPEGYGPEIAAEFLEIIRRLAHLQDVTGVDFPLPDEFTSLDVASLIEAEHLLNGDALMGKWTDAELDTLSDEVLDVLSSGPARLELDGEGSIAIAGHAIPLGMLTHTFASVQLLNKEEVRVSRGAERRILARLSPGQDDSYSRRLIDPPQRRIGDPFAPLALVSASALHDVAVTTIGRAR